MLLYSGTVNLKSWNLKYKYCKYHDIDTISNPELFWYERKTKYKYIRCILCKRDYWNKWRSKNAEKESQRLKIYRKENPEKIKELKKDWNRKNKKSRNAYVRGYEKQRKKIDPAFKLSKVLRTRIWTALKRNSKSNSTIELTGCNLKQLKKYIENKFEDGMNWDNYGVWHIDHIIPCAQFNLSDPEQQKICFHYTNLQPMWGEDNLKKGARLNG